MDKFCQFLSLSMIVAGYYHFVFIFKIALDKSKWLTCVSLLSWNYCFLGCHSCNRFSIFEAYIENI